MPEIPRNKGHYQQSGSVVLMLLNGSSNVVNHDGTLDSDGLYLQEEYPVLFGLIGTDFNDAGKGDDAATQFRTPTLPTAPSGMGYRIRF